MKITVEGTPEECAALQQVLSDGAKLDANLKVDIVAIETIVVVEPSPKVSLVLINGGLGDRKRQTVELPKLP